MLTVKVGQTIDAMYIGFYSTVLPPNNITDYHIARGAAEDPIRRSGVQTAEIIGGQNFALRAWLDPAKAGRLRPDRGRRFSQRCRNNDYISGVGNTKGQMVQVNLSASTSLHTVDDFKNHRGQPGQRRAVRLSRCRQRERWAPTITNPRSASTASAPIYIGIQVAPAANLLDVIKGVRAVLPDIFRRSCRRVLPATIIYDSTAFVNSSIHEVATSR